MSYDFTIPGGESRRFPVGGKYCPDDIVVTAQGGGVELPELDNPGTAADLMEGKELIGQDGQPVTGTFTLTAEMAEQGGLIEQIQEALVGAAAPDGSEDLNAELTAQESAIAELMGILRQKAGLVPVADEAAMAKAAAFDIIMNGEG